MTNYFTAIHFVPAYYNAKKAVHQLLDGDNVNSPANRIVNGFLIILILLNVIDVALETVGPIYLKYQVFFRLFDLFSVAVFTIEYILRVWSSTCNPKYNGHISGRLKYMASAGAVIDLVAIIPFYLPLVFALDLRFLRILRMLEFARILKLGRYVRASRMLRNVIVSRREELVISFFASISLIVLSSCLIYYAEHGVQPDKFSNIPNTMWFCVVTLTTVGYGDMYPVTAMGKILSSFVAIIGIAMFAIPTGILASGFAEEFRKFKKHKIYCPHCGEEIDTDHVTEKKHVHY